MKKKKEMILLVIGMVFLVLITVGVTYAIFNYVKEGTTENSITTGTITFIYEEIDKQGAGISISDAYPMSDEVGKAQTGSGNVFNFKVKSQTTNSAAIPYTVTARMKADSTLDQSAVRVYLTEVEGENETQVLLDNYNNLPQTSISVPDGTIEKEIYTDTVPKGSSNYEKNFRLRIWIDEDTDFSSGDMNDKTFTITVNVYANAKVVTGNEELNVISSATALTIGTSVTAIDGSKWHVLEDSASGTDTVVLLSDYNLNSDGTYNTECGININSTYKCSAMAFDPNNTNVYDQTDSNNIGYFIKNTYEPLVTTALSGTTNVTIPTAYQIATADGKNFNQANLYLSNSWLLTTTYWTQTINASVTTEVWCVNASGSILVDDTSSISPNGARPVITTLKSNLIAE